MLLGEVRHKGQGREAGATQPEGASSSTSILMMKNKTTPTGLYVLCLVLLLQTFTIWPQAVNVTPIVLTKAEADAIAYNTDPAKGPVFEPSKDDWWVTVCAWLARTHGDLTKCCKYTQGWLVSRRGI